MWETGRVTSLAFIVKREHVCYFIYNYCGWWKKFTNGKWCIFRSIGEWSRRRVLTLLWTWVNHLSCWLMWDRAWDGACNAGCCEIDLEMVPLVLTDVRWSLRGPSCAGWSEIELEMVPVMLAVVRYILRWPLLFWLTWDGAWDGLSCAGWSEMELEMVPVLLIVRYSLEQILFQNFILIL